MPNTILTTLRNTVTRLPHLWHRLTTWCRVKKRVWLYTKPLDTLGPLQLTYPHLDAFYAHSWALFSITNLLPWVLLLSWYFVSVACTWQPWRQHLLQDLCVIPGIETQHNKSVWPIPRFHGAVGGSGVGENASRYLERDGGAGAAGGAEPWVATAAQEDGKIGLLEALTAAGQAE